MGRISNKIKENIKSEILIKPVQKLAFEYLDLLFQDYPITNIQIGYEIGIGERGDLQNKENHLLKINFEITNLYIFEFYLFYDQLEFYILKNSKIVGKCNLEDYTDDVDEMVATYIHYLKKTLTKLEIPFNK